MTKVRDRARCFTPLPPGVPVDDHVWLLDEDFTTTHPVVLLYYLPQQEQWVLDMWGDSPAPTTGNPALTSPDDLHAAQQWVARFLTCNNNSGVTFASEVSTWTITEWRLVAVGGRVGWIPLFDLTDTAQLPFPVRNPATGARADPVTDNQLRVSRNRGASPIHPIGTELLRATPGDIDEITLLLAQSLVDLPHARWLVPDDRTRLWVLADYLAIHVEHAITSGYGHVDIIREHDPDPLARDRIKGVTGAAVWLYRDDHTPSIPDYRDRRQLACREVAGRFEQLDAALTRLSPSTPHHLLAALAVAGHRRRRHLGSLLLHAHLAQLDAGHRDAAAVITSPPARGFLRRHGFSPLPSVPLTTRRPIPGTRIAPCHRLATKANS
ncbi:hypothetical protein [Actinoplanes sp. NPDC020271]|uniref:hypothetical protein n=1 Tax=Actinoplanes sp. NPDC020271 TaxID=3363896 RepID=UPI0037BDC5DC